MEEGTELLTRLKKALVDNEKVALPMFTSCSPGWIKYIEHMYPTLLDNLSTCKSPQQMFGTLAKTYFAKKRNLNPKDVVSVSIMPCTAKKFEANRPEMRDSGFQDVDYVLTTRELAMMVKQAGIDFRKLEDSQYDSVMGEGSGAAVIFGATGGVMEAALRTAYEIVTGREVPFQNLNIMPVRGMEGVKEAKVLIKDCLPEWSFLEGAELSVAIAHGLANAKQVMDAVRDGKYVNVNWTTASELNNDYFTIERSLNAYNFDFVTYYPGAGNSFVPLNYHVIDYTPHTDKSYY